MFNCTIIFYNKYLGAIIRTRETEDKIKFCSILKLDKVLNKYAKQSDYIKVTRVGLILNEPDLLWICRFDFINFCSDLDLGIELILKHFDTNVLIQYGSFKEYIKCIMNELSK